MNVRNNDFVVVRDSWDIQVVQAIRVTKQMVFYMDTYWSKPRERRLRLQDVIFSGQEAAAKRLCEQLKSSKAQREQDTQAAYNRQAKRDEGFIAAANSDSILSEDRQAK